MDITMNNNPIIYDPSNEFGICFAQTRDTLMDTEIYKRFIYNIDNKFRRSQFWRDYKQHLYDLGLYRDQRHASITSEMVNLEAHHNMISLEYMTIMITEHILNYKGCVTTFEVLQELEEANRNNQVCIIILDETEHQKYHSDPSEFISIRQCFGFPFDFISKYIDGMTLDISFKLLLQLKQEEQYNGSFSPSEVKARDQILSWQMYNNNY